MDGLEGDFVSAKRTYVVTGSTPSKPKRKRVRKLFSPSARKPLSFVQSPVNSNVADNSLASPNRKVSA